MGGGPTHVDTWDMKPPAPAEIRGPYKPIATSVPGVHINELEPRLAKLSQHYRLIRSMTHDTPIRNHPDAMHNCLTGQAKAPDDAPAIGSVMAKLRPTQRPGLLCLAPSLRWQYDRLLLAFHLDGWFPGEALRSILHRQLRE